MSLFDNLVTEALKNSPELSTLRVVVEKEILHHDILRILSQNQLLSSLTFIGGTALRACYGGGRLSEDLDFTGGGNFSRDSLSNMAQILQTSLYKKYGLQVSISEPIKEHTNVDTWKVKIETRPQHKNMPAQRINIDICAVPSYDEKPVLLLNHYNIDMGTNGLVIQTQSREEIFADKILAFVLRKNRIKHRDLWDIAWLHQKRIEPRLDLLANKLSDRNIAKHYFLEQLTHRVKLLDDEIIAKEFTQEMSRFLSISQMQFMNSQQAFWESIVYLMQDLEKQILLNSDISGKNRWRARFV